MYKSYLAGHANRDRPFLSPAAGAVALSPVDTMAARMPECHLMPDDALVRQLAAGPPKDGEAFGALYGRHREWAWRVARRFCGEDLAHDAVQEAFLYLARKGAVSSFALTSRLTTFLYPALKHEAQAALRKSARTLGAGAAALAQVPAPAPADADADLRQVLANLPDEQHEAVLLRFVDGLSMAEIAAATGVAEGTVKTRLHHAIRKLREDPACRQYFGQD